jgi:hypothetical protein
MCKERMCKIWLFSGCMCIVRDIGTFVTDLKWYYFHFCVAYAHTHTYTHAHTRTLTHTPTHTHSLSPLCISSAYTSIHRHTNTHTNTHTHTHTHTHVGIVQRAHRLQEQKFSCWAAVTVHIQKGVKWGESRLMGGGMGVWGFRLSTLNCL